MVIISDDYFADVKKLAEQIKQEKQEPSNKKQ